MKTIKLALALLLLGAAAAGNAWADRGHHARIGVMIGPYWGPAYYQPYPYNYSLSPYYYPPYYPPVVVERAAPQVYIEQPTAPPAPAPATANAAAPSHYWYYCTAAKAYYPYVNECPGGWQKVSPQPPGQH